MKRTGAVLLAAVAAMLLLGANTLPASPNPAGRTDFHNARLSHLRGMTVEDPNAQALGMVKDFVLDTASARVEYALVGSGGVLGVGGQNRALPASDLSVATILRGILGTGITREQWDASALFEGNLAALPDPPAPAPAPTGPTPAGTSANGARLELASKLLGATVITPAGQSLGTVTDLLLDLDRQKPALAIVRHSRFLRRAQVFAVPLPLLTRHQGDELVLNASPQRLQQAPVFSEQAWNDAATQGAHVIYRVAGSAET